MNTINAGLTLMDWAKRLDPDGSTADIAELLNQTNEVVQDIPFQEANQPTSHRLTVRTSIPTPTWRGFNQGVSPTKSTTAQFDEGIGMLEDWSNCDKDLAELNGNLNAFRLSEAKPHLEGMTQEFCGTLFYGNATTNPLEFNGIATRYNAISGATNADNILDGVGDQTSGQTSIYLVGWSPETVFGLFPKGSKAGIMHEDLGLQTVTVTAGANPGLMRAYQDHWQWKAGLAVKDWRYIVRIANIDLAATQTGATPEANLTDLMVQALELIPSQYSVRLAFYVPRVVRALLRRQITAKSNVWLSLDEAAGKKVLSFDGVPVRRCDQISVSEGHVQ